MQAKGPTVVVDQMALLALVVTGLKVVMVEAEAMVAVALERELEAAAAKAVSVSQEENAARANVRMVTTFPVAVAKVALKVAVAKLWEPSMCLALLK